MLKRRGSKEAGSEIEELVGISKRESRRNPPLNEGNGFIAGSGTGGCTPVEEGTAGTGDRTTAEAIVAGTAHELDAITSLEIGDGSEINGPTGVGLAVVVVNGGCGAKDEDVVAALAGEGVITAAPMEDRSRGNTTDQLIGGGANDLIAAIAGSTHTNRHQIAKGELRLAEGAAAFRIGVEGKDELFLPLGDAIEADRAAESGPLIAAEVETAAEALGGDIASGDAVTGEGPVDGGTGGEGVAAQGHTDARSLGHRGGAGADGQALGKGANDH